MAETMKKKRNKQEWGLAWSDIECGGGGSTSGKTGQFNRKLKTTSYEIFLIHKPTGVRVDGEVPPGNYSKKEMRMKRENLIKALFLTLEVKVAKKLRVKGR